MQRLLLLIVMVLTAGPAQSAILFQQTLNPTSGVARFRFELQDSAVLTRGLTWIGVSGGTITQASSLIEGTVRSYRWEVFSEDEDGNQEIFLDGTNNPWFSGCTVSPGAPSCADGTAFRSQLHNNIVRNAFDPSQTYDDCQPFNGVFGVVCGRRYLMDLATFEIDVAGSSAITLTVSETRLAGAIPEPASWTMLIAGFGLTGAALRRKAGGAVRSKQF